MDRMRCFTILSTIFFFLTNDVQHTISAYIKCQDYPIILGIASHCPLCPSTIGCPTDLGLIFSNPDLSGIAEGSLIVTSVKHKSSMELNEEGAEATAATAVIISRMSTPIFSVDRPFFFSLVDDKTKVPIMMGVVNNPNPGAPTMRRPEPGNKDKEGYPVDKSEVSSKGLPPK